jgi:hypothetical protein
LSAVAACLIAGSALRAESFAWREGGGSAGITNFTDVTCDDTYLSYLPSGTRDNNYGTASTLNLLHQGNGMKYQALFGWTDLFTLVPPTSGGQPIVIDSAVIRLKNHNNNVSVGPGACTIYRVTTPWLLSAAGSNETNVSWNERDMAGDLTWAAGGFDTADFTTVNAVGFTYPSYDMGAFMMLPVAALLQDLYDSGTNAGFVIRPDTPNALPGGINSSESDDYGWYPNGPALLMEYHYGGAASAGTTILVK